MVVINQSQSTGALTGFETVGAIRLAVDGERLAEHVFGLAEPPLSVKELPESTQGDCDLSIVGDSRSR